MTGSSECDRASFLLELGRPREAMEPARRAVAEDPASGNAWGVLCEVHLALGEYQAALSAADRAAACGYRRDPGWPHRLRAVALGELGRKEGIEAARRAVEVDPQSWQNHNTLATTMLAFIRRRPTKRNYRAIAEVAEWAVQLGPTEPAALLTLAWVRWLLNCKAESRELADGAVALAPNDAQVLAGRARLMDAHSNLTGALRTLGRAAALAPAGNAAGEFADTSVHVFNRGLLIGVLCWLPVGVVVELSVEAAGRAYTGPFQILTVLLCAAIALTPFLVIRRRLGPQERAAVARAIVRSPTVRIRVAGIALVVVALSLPAGPPNGGDGRPEASDLAGALLFVAILAICLATPLGRLGCRVAAWRRAR